MDDLCIKRSRYTSFSIDDQSALDLRQLLRGNWQVDDIPTIQAFSPLANKATKLNSSDIEFLAKLGSSDFLPVSGFLNGGAVDRDTISRLIGAGLLVSDSDQSPDAELRAREEQLAAAGWHKAALDYHFASKWGESEPAQGMESATNESGEGIDRYQLIVDAHGKPPSHFYSIEPISSTDLTEVEEAGDLFELLEKRRTVRLFDSSRALPLATLSTVLHYVCGCLGWMRLSESVVALKKSSPSGGALHPTESYVLAMNVDGVTPGFHHYNVANHRLDLVSAMSTEQARKAAVDLSAGQDNLSSAPVLIVLVSRYDRLFWKYRDHKKAYKVSLMDAAHLSQTFYLVCEALGLGACFTGAIRDSVIESHLNLDTATQGVAGVCACGIPSANGEDLEMHPNPYEPGSGEI